MVMHHGVTIAPFPRELCAHCAAVVPVLTPIASSSIFPIRRVFSSEGLDGSRLANRPLKRSAGISSASPRF